MAVFDILNEISEKQVTKTSLGEERIFGAVVGIVASNYEKEMPGRICVNIPVRDKEANQLKWAKVAAPYTGKKWGQYFLPEIGDQVLLLFEDGNIEKPYIIGSIPTDKDQFLKKSVGENNEIKQIMTRNGNKIVFEDGKDDGQKDKISIVTAEEMHQLILDNENQKILLEDKEGNCRVEMQTGNGKMLIHAEKKLEITVGDKIKISMNGETGKLKIEADAVSVEASRKMTLATDGSAKLSGQQTVIEGTSSLKNSCSGMVVIEGSPIKIG